MKNIALKKLELTNYRNINYIALDFLGNSKIVGENRIGKTNILESIYFLLADKLLDGSNDIQAIKPLRDTKLQVSVKATFDVEGLDITLEKQYGEKWVTTRGTQETTMQGHYTNYIYNGVKQSTLKVYNELLSKDFGLENKKFGTIDLIQMLINPFFLGNIGESLKWTELRSAIIDLVGDVTDADVIAKNPNFSLIAEDLKSYSGRIDQIKKKISSEIDGLENNILSDAAKIQMLEQTPCPSEEEIQVARKGIEDCEDKIAKLKVVGVDTASIEIQEMINTTIAEINRLKQEDLEKARLNSGTSEIDENISKLRTKQNELLTSKQNTMSLIYDLKRDATNRSNGISQYLSNRENWLKRLKEIDNEIQNVDIVTVCPHCGKPYTEEEIESSRKKVVDFLNQEKQDILTKGKENKESLNKAQEELNKLNQTIQETQEKVNAIDLDLKSLAEQITALMEKRTASENVVVASNPEIANKEWTLEQQRVALKESKEAFLKGNQDNSNLILQEQDKMQTFKKVIADYEYYTRQQGALAVVRLEKEKHEKAKANAEQKKELVNQFMYVKLKMLDENVAKVFGNIKFQLIKENINGGFDPICKPYIYDVAKGESTTVSWKSGSKSERVITGIAIAECIKSALDLPNLPYLFDEGGEISSDTFATKFNTQSQLICVKIVDNIMTPIVQPIR